MFRFLRTLRLSLLAENRTRKYLLYAIGEIVLVVLGILIALQIDTWNEVRKNRAFEKEVLAQIKENLLQDKMVLQAVARSYQEAIAASGKLLDPSKRSAFPDSIPFWLGRVARFERFNPLTSSYEVLKSKGLDIVSKDTLRLLLGQYYDDKTARASLAMEDIEYSFNNEWLPLMRDHITDFKFGKYLRVISMDAFLNNTNILRILVMNRDNYSAGLVQVQGVLNHIDTLLSELP
ncbi:DUF6090 family protein [Robiginitalea marina]|uniref:DUF6090 family protein n=1 Tax=Robiginitalea marina TaxID=2954105 RepID=A0ABT1B0L1_9FLAO|nr:DUF6090 family protein [Robiginitalea marina]